MEVSVQINNLNGVKYIQRIKHIFFLSWSNEKTIWCHFWNWKYTEVCLRKKILSYLERYFGLWRRVFLCGVVFLLFFLCYLNYKKLLLLTILLFSTLYMANS